jgi:hypothetical protein
LVRGLGLVVAQGDADAVRLLLARGANLQPYLFGNVLHSLFRDDENLDASSS